MKKLLALGCGAAIGLLATTAYAQNGSDVTGPGPGTIVTFAPLPVPSTPGGGTAGGRGAAGAGGGGGGGGAAAAAVAVGAVTAAGASLMGTTAVISPATNQAIPAAAAQSVGQVVMSGSATAIAQVSAALQAAGAPAGVTATLMNALASLAGATPANAYSLVVGAAQAFNSFVQSAPASFFAGGTLPAQFLAVHAALLPMVNSIQ